ncbi:flagellar biosynthesis anti-sigma factor FlgM [Rubripirellula amarantea]|uniref:Anti-sigma-28 factor FlgM C-terminal domain-containing protein n=1 Tax=Rubripirellula amarantea TaxID=2527999 RepID=A0A5C5WRT2_9BACT|nr:flagellar biosynthesis anti-sigma factor FlgM [Rubripirellula amarantea]MDA8744185.1 flagellar biosynthesis anti-sigma factor FlgM [Rubripirellula amarantea]TWT53257.1 hypothetical protein Pla22_08850 [Rubripirellula amarantea]
MQIYGPFRVSTTQATGAASPTNRVQNAAQTAAKPRAPQADQLDLSASNRLDQSSAIAGGGEIRIDKVAQIRREIADGSYETTEKLDAALDSLLDQLG